MILITGGAGFIGSNLQAALVRRGHETVVVDTLGSDGKWRNLAKHPPARVVHPDDLDAFLDSRPPVEMVFHLGAVSATTAVDGDHTWATNVELSRRLWEWCADRSVRMVYASSAATYGDGAQGFDDDFSLAALERLRPLNLYGWTKHAFDLLVARTLLARREQPPQWAGLKFFNVYGPNEYHKDRMISVVKVKHDEVAAGQASPAVQIRSSRPAGRRAGARLHLGRRRGRCDAVADADSLGQRAVQPGDRAGADLSGSGACGVRRGRPATGSGVHRHAGQPARAVSVVHPGADGAAAGGGLHAASSRRWRKASAATCRTTWPGTDPYV